MPFGQQIILAILPIPLAIIIVIISMIISIGGILLVRYFIPHKRLKVHNDVAGPIFATLGVIYAVLLAFVVVITWENFDRSSLNAEKEASFVADLYTDAEAFQEPAKEQIRALLKEYATSVINVEWKALSTGAASQEVGGILKKIWRFYSTYNPETAAQTEFFRESVHKLNEVGELRRIRIVDAKNGVHPILWFVLIAGGIITLSFSFFFGTENLMEQLILTSLLSVLIGLILFTILELDYPFTGQVSIQPTAMYQMLNFGK